MQDITKKTLPLYRKIKEYILDRIASGEWPPSTRVPSENELVKTFKVSRMTTNRALRELTDEGFLVRVAGVGTFISDLKAQSHPLEIHNIAEEIQQRGHSHTAQVLTLEKTGAAEKVAARLNITAGTIVFHSVILHKEQNIPLQLEDRFVNSDIVPDYDQQDFTQITPHEYLMKIAPLQKAEHIVKAILPPVYIQQQLHITPQEPCLLIKRRTWTGGQVASSARLYHPGSRYELSGLFRP